MRNAPNRDTIAIWIAVIAGSGILSLLIRHASIHRFGMDEFSGNILFFIGLALLIGLYLAFQSVFEDISRAVVNFFRREESVAIAETSSGEYIAIATIDEPQQTMQFTDTVSTERCDVIDDETEVSTLPQSDAFEVLDVWEDGTRHIRFADGSEGYAGEGMSDEEILFQNQYQSSNLYLDEDELLENFLSELSDQERFDFENNIKRVRIDNNEEEYGCFSSVPEQNVINNADGSTTIEEYESTVFITADGRVVFLDLLDEMIKFYDEHKDTTEKIISQKKECEEAYDELKRNEDVYNLEQVSFICAYITHTMKHFMESHELDKLHHNAKLWTKKATATFTSVQLRSDHLSKEDLKHLGYNIGKFLRLKGPVIATFIKNVFQETFSTHKVTTINAKLTESNPDKDRIPLLSAEQMDAMFAHFKRYKTINLKIAENIGQGKK